jgi:hypothetical protein
MVSSEVVSVRIECGPPSRFDRPIMRAPGVALSPSLSKGEVQAADLSKVR